MNAWPQRTHIAQTKAIKFFIKNLYAVCRSSCLTAGRWCSRLSQIPLYQKMKHKRSSSSPAIVYYVLYKSPPFIPKTNPYQYFILMDFHFWS